jgi:hypothetical protein
MLMMQISEIEAFRACRVLFGTDLNLSRDFLSYLQPAGAHSAFRKMAKQTHPDCNPKANPPRTNQVQLFQDLNQAHQVLQNYLRQRDLVSASQHSQPGRKPPRPARTQTPPRAHSQPGAYARQGTGPLPSRPLQFGLYLYYRGLISFKILAGALVWQRQQRPSVGQIAQRWGWLNPEDISRIIACRKTGRFGERAEYLELLSALQVRAILLHQRTRQDKLGSYFVSQGLLTNTEIEQLLHDLSEHNLKYRHGFPQHFYYHR